MELSLGFITVWEQVVRQSTIDEYKQYPVMLLQLKDMYLFEEDVLLKTKAKNIEQALLESPSFLRTGAHRKNEDGTFSQKYLDIGTDYDVLPSDFNYDAFFAYKLRQLDLLDIDAFLEYHLSNYYDNNLPEFSRFLRICIRKHEAKLLSTPIIETVNEFIETKQKQLENQQKELQGLAENQLVKSKKVKIKREANDKLTCLNQEQTVLLMYYLQQERVLLKDEYLSDKDAGIAFESLTGYSQNTLRQNLSNFHLYQNKPNLKEIDNLLTRLKIAIDKDLKQK